MDMKMELLLKVSKASIHKAGGCILPQDLAKSRSIEIRVYTFPIILKFDRYLGGTAAEMPAKFRSDTISITPNLATPTLHGIWR